MCTDFSYIFKLCNKNNSWVVSLQGILCVIKRDKQPDISGATWKLANFGFITIVAKSTWELNHTVQFSETEWLVSPGLTFFSSQILQDGKECTRSRIERLVQSESCSCNFAIGTYLRRVLLWRGGFSMYKSKHERMDNLAKMIIFWYFRNSLNHSPPPPWSLHCTYILPQKY